MPTVKNIIFRNLTDADFFNINKPRGSENQGGGQSYIDFPVRSIAVDDWHEFFNGIGSIDESEATQGPSWEFPICSIGLPQPEVPQDIKIYQRRAASVSITSQKIESTRSNRVHSWHPSHGFPRPIDNTIRNQCPDGLMVYLVSTYEGEVWAGWYLNDGMSPSPIQGNIDNTDFSEMFSSESIVDGRSQMLGFDAGQISLDVSNSTTPFIVLGGAAEVAEQPLAETDAVIEAEVEADANTLFEYDFSADADNEVKVVEQVVKTRKRNTKLVKKLKELYGHRCQVTGDEFVFAKKNGENYTEAHHLIPLGEGGSDTPENLVILSPLIHRMLHHANVEPINMDQIMHLEDGSALLEITINETPYTIEWHPKHAELFK